MAALDDVFHNGDGDQISLGDTIADTRMEVPGEQLEASETRMLLAQAISGLPERDKIVLTLYYYEGLTLSEIGQVLGVTESRICQLHTKAVLQLRSRLSLED
jgi:RNA polymerase sigma factor for flagellar operon FliA